MLADHFLDADARGRSGHGVSRIEWLATLADLDPTARPERVLAETGFELEACYGWFDRSPYKGDEDMVWITRRT